MPEGSKGLLHRSSMRVVFFTEELMGVALKFSQKSANMGSLLVSWDSPENPSLCAAKNKKKFIRSVQTTISLCFLTLLFTIVLFFLCTLDSNKPAEQQPWISFPRLAQTPNLRVTDAKRDAPAYGAAIQGMGMLFRRGNRPCNELIVAHVSEDLVKEEFRLFLRVLHRSGATARADVAFIFPSNPLSGGLAEVIDEENRFFRRSIAYWSARLAQINETETESESESPGIEMAISNTSLAVFNFMAFRKSAEEMSLRAGRNISDDAMSWGSVLGFEMAELDPSDVLSGFLDHPAMQLRRWLCYQMLLGMMKHRYKHVLLTQIKGVLIIGDALSVVRKKDWLYLSSEDRTWLEEANWKPKQRTRSLLSRQESMESDIEQVEDEEIELEITEALQEDPDTSERQTQQAKKRPVRARRKDQPQKRSKDSSGIRKGMMESVYGKQMWKSFDRELTDKRMLSSAVIMGAAKPVRNLANAMTTEIVRVALERNSRTGFSDQALLNYLIQKSSILGKRIMDHLHVARNEESVIHALQGSKQGNVFQSDNGGRFAIIHGNGDALRERGSNGNSIANAILLDMCSSPLESLVYSDCQE